ncbi:Carboxypeptidase S1 like A [Fusarium albosuccineum]|uniref:Carboxypeptidase S1 like A n=1 Tax=Fusarium albosuccineum TaxID=1237068 RepID=A0A8H4LJ26_9HYPO|nr:Carboxypeptidase S1 like A [Fusarium albosuccineum]
MKALLSLISLGSMAAAQEYISPPRDVRVLPSKLFKGAEISYKKASVCETTEGVNAYSGYVTLPKQLLPDARGWDNDQSAHLFFWFFEARNDPLNAATSIYLGGGPGTTSFDATSNFPCFINPDGNSTTINELSWNNNVNMLYIDQPIGTGFSYVTLVNGTVDVLGPPFTPREDDEVPQVNETNLQATLDARIPETIPRTTMSGARTLWVFAQVWFSEFPEWNTTNDAISLWASSYGGFYGPEYFSHFQDQNNLIRSGKPPLRNAKILNLATLGLQEPVIDARAMAMGYPRFGYNNTYGIQIFNEETYEKLMAAIIAPDVGCYALIDNCCALVAEGDPERYGTNETVNKACLVAMQVCFVDIQGAYLALSDRSPFDVTHSNLTVYPWHYMDNFLNQAWVQKDLGVPLNFTYDWGAIDKVFLHETGDPVIGSLTTLEKVLDSGVNVALVYGDRDYRCPWYSGENVSLTLDFAGSGEFRSAGYEYIVTNSSYNGGFVREYGNLSFSRVFESGHGISAYQPETMYRIFERAMFGRDIATGKVNLAQDKDYTTTGPKNVDGVKNRVEEAPDNKCFVRLAPASCTDEQLQALADGTAVVKDWVVVEPKGVKPKPIPAPANEEPKDTGGQPGPSSKGSRLQAFLGYALVPLASVYL